LPIGANTPQVIASGALYTSRATLSSTNTLISDEVMPIIEHQAADPSTRATSSSTAT
jgi:hypothetical protein